MITTPAMQPGMSLRDMMIFNLSYFVLIEQVATEQDFITVYGTKGSSGFWDDVLFSTDTLPRFIYTLSKARARTSAELTMVNMSLGAAMLDAFRDDQTWFRGNFKQMAEVLYFREIPKPDEIIVKSRQAAEWLLRSPRWRSVTPGTLKAYLERDLSQVVVANTPPRNRGGRRAKYDWDAVRSRVIEHFQEEGMPAPGDGGLARAERIAAECFPADAMPAESLIREHVGLALKAYQAAIG